MDNAVIYLKFTELLIIDR